MSARTVGEPDRVRHFQDCPEGRGGHGMAESDQLTLNPSVAPTGILAGHPSVTTRGWSTTLGRDPAFVGKEQ
jgi:hypothetical protein